MRLEEKEAESVQLNAGLLRACAGERSLFCRGVQPGSARVFRCGSRQQGKAHALHAGSARAFRC